MSHAARERLVLVPIGDDPEVGRWLAALEDARHDTPWVAEEILEDPEPAELGPLHPWPDREPGNGVGSQRHLSRIDGQSLEQHLGRLAGVRAFVLEHLKPMTNAEFHRVRILESYDVAPDWAVHHLLQHEAEHRSHIAWLRDSFPRP